jgi:hypothetical protein
MQRKQVADHLVKHVMYYIFEIAADVFASARFTSITTRYKVSTLLTHPPRFSSRTFGTHSVLNMADWQLYSEMYIRAAEGKKTYSLQQSTAKPPLSAKHALTFPHSPAPPPS